MKRIAGFEERRLVQSCATNVDEKQSTGALQITHRSELPNMIRVNVVESTELLLLPLLLLLLLLPLLMLVPDLDCYVINLKLQGGQVMRQ